MLFIQTPFQMVVWGGGLRNAGLPCSFYLVLA